MKAWRFLILAGLIGLTGCTSPEEEKHTPVNLALHKQYTLNEKPSYALCADAGDNEQLTDGRIMTDSKSTEWFWTNKGTVGWNRTSRPIEITVDLGETKPISGFSFHTAAGRADVNWPSIINVLVSEDGKTFYQAAEMVNTARAPEAYSIYTYITRDIKTKGRYVRFQCIPNGRYFFCDEIEVLSGPSENLNMKYSKPASSPDNLLMTSCIRKRMLDDILSIRKELENSKVQASVKKEISDSLDPLEKKAMEYEFSGDKQKFKAIIPLNALHAEIISTFAKTLRAEGLKELTLWHKDRYSRLALFEKPETEIPQLSVRMMNGECRADVLNITNSGDEKVKLSFRIEGLPENKTSPYLKIYEVKGVDTKDFKVDFSALVPIESVIEIPSGMTGQLWFSFNPQHVTPGTYKGIIEVFRDEKLVQKVPLELSISKVRFPEKINLKSLIWDYSFPVPHYALTQNNFKDAIAMMRKYFINIPVGRAVLASYPGKKDFDKTGTLIRKLDFSLFDEWAKLWPDATAYQIFLLVTQENDKFAGFTPGTPEFEKAIAEWLNAFSKHVKSKGLDPKKIMFNTLDEPRKPQNYQTLEKWVSAMKKSGAGFSIFSDPVCLEKENNMRYAPSALKKVDILCPLMAYYLSYSKDIKDFFEKEKAAGKEMWFYMCTEPNREFDPSYFRLQPWQAFKYGATGSGFWSFSDTGKLPSNWNPYANPTGNDYSPVYIDEDSITTAKQMEAVREGIEDYQYLIMLRNAATDSAAKEKACEVIRKTEELSGKEYWKKWDTQKTPCSFADNARNEVLDRLEESGK